MEGQGLPISRALERLIKKLNNPGRARRAVSVALAEASIDRIKQGFRTEKDPYGKRWKPKVREDGRKVLSGPTGRLKGGWHRVRADEDGFVVAPSVAYAAYHQRGNARLPRRMMVPSDDKGLPRAWRRDFEQAAADVLEKWFKR